MKKLCTNCTHFKNEVCAKNSKNGYFNCSKYKTIPMSELHKEYVSLMVSKKDPDRLEFLKEKLSEINGGTI